MNLKTVVDSIIEAMREKGLDEKTIETILEEWRFKEGLEDLNIGYDRNKIRSLFQIIEDHYSSGLIPQVEEEEEAGIEEGELTESIEKELEELVRILAGSEEEMEEEMPPVEETEEEDKKIDEDLERELREFAEFLEMHGQFHIEEESEEEEEVQEESREEVRPTVKIVEQEEEKKLRSLVEELVESTPEPIKMSDVRIRGLRLAAVISGEKVEKVLVFRESENKPAIGKLHEIISSIWRLTGYEIHGFDSFHVKSGALILYGEKIEGKTYIVVVESETVGGAKFIVLALRKMLSQEES